MDEDEKILPVGESQETPQAITITIMDPSALGNTSSDTATPVVKSVQGETGLVDSNLLVVSNEGDQPKSILESVTETYQGPDDMPVISSISNPEVEPHEEVETKVSHSFEESQDPLEEMEEEEDDPLGLHCLICNYDMGTSESEEKIPFFKTQTTATTRRLALFLGSLVGQKLTARKSHSDIICRRCFGLLDRVDTLEVEIEETKEELVNKYQETLAIHGGRARRRKPARAKKTDYVFPKIEPEDEDEQMIGMETDGTFEPRIEDLMEEEHDRREDFHPDDEEWEPDDYKKPKIKREAPEPDSGVPRKRKRGRPRKDTVRPKACVQNSVERKLVEEKESIVNVKGNQPVKVKSSSSEGIVGKKQNKPENDTDIYLSELLSCSECGEYFDSEPLYKIHCSEAHVEPTGVKCPHCPLVFDLQYDLDSHLINHTPNQLSCQECGVGFKTASILLRHIKKLHPNASTTCTYCNATFINADQFEFHNAMKHRRGKRKLDNTDKPENSTSSIICEECGKVCKSTVTHQTHKYNEHVHLYPHECKVCLRRFTKHKLLESHLKTHINGSVECPRCSVKFGTEYHLVDHMYYVHGQKKVLMCNVCNKLFSSPTSLKAHKDMEHRENVECPEVCTQCGEKYPSKSGLRRHMLTHTRSYRCKYCQRDLSSKASLDIHINMVHTREHSFFCRHCNKEFFAKHLLQMHIKRVHSDRSDFQFKCKQCGKMYLQEWELTLHIKTHTNERNYKCDICGDGFYTLSRMRYHKATHKTTRDSECPICSQMFRRDVDTKNHLRRVHKVIHPGQFMDLCSRHGVEKARELSRLEIVENVGQEGKMEGEKVDEILEEVDSENITIVCMEDTEPKPPLQVVMEEDVQTTTNEKQEIAIIYEELESGENREDATQEEESDGRAGMVKTKTCSHCQEEVPIVHLMSHLDSHEHQHYFCPFCQHTSPRLVLSRHIQEEHSLCLITCEVCSVKFLDSQSFSYHRSSHDNGQYKCASCGIRFGTNGEFSNHLNLMHVYKDNETYTCPLCKKIYEARGKYVIHVIMRHRGLVNIDGMTWGARGSIVCSVCQKRFKKASHYLIHEKIHRSQRYLCHHCQSSYSTLSHLQDHLIAHQFGDYECGECTIKFTSLLQLSHHEERVHKVTQDKICNFCNKTFRDQVSLICHRRKEHPESEESQKARYSCGECGMKFMGRGNLVRHLKMHQRMKCDQACSCEICGKVLSSKYTLKSHIRTHTGEASCKCDICDKTFVTKYTLLDHIRRVHEDVNQMRDKECKTCDRTFFTNTELKNHMKTHTGERPYRCNICKEAYTSSSNLRYHMQKHSNVMFVCQECQRKFENYVRWSAHLKRIHRVSCVKEYIRQHGILQAVKNDDSSLYIIPPEAQIKMIHSEQQLNDLDADNSDTLAHTSTVNAFDETEITTDSSLYIIPPEAYIKMIDHEQSLNDLDAENSNPQGVGSEETVVSVPVKNFEDIKDIQVVSYHDAKNPLVHTVDAIDVGLDTSGVDETEATNNSAENFKTGTMECVSEANYTQANDRTKIMISDGWDFTLPADTEETQVMTEAWDGTRTYVVRIPEQGSIVQPGNTLEVRVPEQGQIFKDLNFI